MIKHLNITVTGKVQGVYYRQSTVEAAKTLGISGFVRNEKNGNVYIEAEGEEEPLKKFSEWCKVGPSRARVDEIKVIEGDVQNFSGFIILKSV